MNKVMVNIFIIFTIFNPSIYLSSPAIPSKFRPKVEELNGIDKELTSEDFSHLLQEPKNQTWYNLIPKWRRCII